MFDPDRDEKGGLPFWARVGVVALFTALAGAALLPAVTGFESGPDLGDMCLAIRDGWHADHPAPNAAEMAAVAALYPPMLTPAQAADPATRARFQAEWRSAEADPRVQAANAWADWDAGAGRCVHESRHRLILSASLLGGAAVVGAGVAFAVARRRTRNGRPEGAAVA